MKKKKHWGQGWAWMLDDGELCHWAVPTREELITRQCLRPIPGAKRVPVYLIPRSEAKPKTTRKP